MLACLLPPGTIARRGGRPGLVDFFRMDRRRLVRSANPGYHPPTSSMRSLSFILPAVLLALTACTSAPRDPGRVVLAIDSPPETLDRRMALGFNAERLALLVTPGLTRIDEHGRASPELAASYEAEGELRWVFRLRPDLRFSDGSTLDAEDVVATFRSLLDPALGSPLRSSYNYLRAVSARDPLTVIFDLNRPFGAMPVDATLGILPSEVVGAEHLDQVRLRPIGAGPFLVRAWDGGDTVLLDPNPTYFRGAPELALEIRTVRDETTRILELRKGRVDVFLGTMSPPLLPALREERGLEVKVGPGAGVSYLLFNVEDPVLSSRELREAVALALDREALARFKFKGAATVADSLFWAEHWAFASGLPTYRHNLQRARELLDAAGFPDPGDGRPRLTLSLKTSTDRFRRSVGLAMASQLAEAGIRIDLQSLEWGTFLGDAKRGNFQLAVLKWPAVVDPDILRYAYHSSSIPTEATAWGGGNRMRYRNAALDSLLEEGRESTSSEERVRIYAEAQRILARDLPALPLLHENVVGVYADDLEGVVVDPQGSMHSLARIRRSGEAKR